ncbi:sulfurtransferase [Gordonia rubripertincta]|uniref:sulfurtransferase n=1 Tax=Gordonia rubripertincta TaxID=36822 RepID=UPI0015FBA3DB|nr:rhodanese-like domain-containing protein [Gordonia rubripertincta]QMU21366.1 sulfurtransferase [Gordonia rubripertincta]
MTVAATALVSAEWLSRHADSTIILDASVERSVDDNGQTVFAPGDAVFRAAHIPGARFADLFATFSDPDAPVAFTRPTVDQMAAAASRLGITPSDDIVVYDQLSGAYAARVWLILRSFGFEHAKVLDGGFARWTRLDHPVSAGDVTVPGAGRLDVVALRDLTGPAFADLDEVYEVAIAESPSATIVCALREPDYTGESGGERPGHIPGSLSVPFPDLLNDDGTFSTAKTRKALQSAGIGVDDEVIVYCGGGINAAGAALAFAEAGYPLPRVYDGSLSEWRAHPELPLVTGPLPR